jgi:hypothetical protein
LNDSGRAIRLPEIALLLGRPAEPDLDDVTDLHKEVVGDKEPNGRGGFGRATATIDPSQGQAPISDVGAVDPGREKDSVGLLVSSDCVSGQSHGQLRQGQ